MRSDRKALQSKKLRINESPVYDLDTQYDSRQSFYGKARVDSNGDTQVLYSYDTPVVKIEGGRVYLLPMWDASPTTLRHVKEFLKQNGFRADSKQQITKAYAKSDVDDSMRQRSRNRYELSPQYDRRQSFYGKAHVERDDEGFEVLYSYNTPVVKIKGGNVYLLPMWDSSNTTLRHVKEFLRQNGFEAGSKQQIARTYKEVNESKKVKSTSKKSMREGRGWALTIPNSIADKLRDAISDGDLKRVLENLRACYDFIHENMPDVYDEYEYEDDIEEINNQLDNVENYDEYDMTLDDVEGEVDYLLNDFWDLCDGYRIFVSI